MRIWQEQLVRRNDEEGNGYLDMPAESAVGYLPIVGAHLIAAVSIIEGKCLGFYAETTDKHGCVNKDKILKT